MTTKLLTAAAMGFFFFGCTKEKIVEVEVPVNAATINITSPMNEDTVKNGNNVHLMATITGKSTMHGYEITLVRDDESVVFYKHAHVHTAVITIDTTFVSNVPAESEMMLTVSGIIDHDGNAQGKVIEYIAVP